DHYLIKLDPLDAPELNSAAELIGTKLFWAMGYHVPENYIVEFDRNALKFDEKATYRDAVGKRHKLTARVMHHLLHGAARKPDGKHRALASKIIGGEVVGPIRYWGTRADDPNDVIPHEQRRDLRGLRVLAAWLNDTDSRAANTLATWVADGGKHYLEH